MARVLVLFTTPLLVLGASALSAADDLVPSAPAPVSPGPALADAFGGSQVTVNPRIPATFLASAATASPAPERRGSASVEAALGFTLDPSTFLLAGGAHYFAGENFGLGPFLQFGVSGNRVILAPTVNFRGVFDLPASGLEQLKPFVQGGLGFAYLHKDHRHGDDDDVGFLFNFGFGADYLLTERVSLGNHLFFNILPDKTLGENFFFSWQFVSLAYRF